jgi:5-methylcytosine-specific restriction endonuclease McrA
MSRRTRNQATRKRILGIVATDSTFARADYGEREVWLGKCLHCGGRLAVELDGEPVSRATIEHIVPRSHGGTDDLENLGLACARCNFQKGVRHDVRRPGDPKLAELIERLRARRRQRWRDPAPAPSPDAVLDAEEVTEV